MGNTQIAEAFNKLFQPAGAGNGGTGELPGRAVGAGAKSLAVILSNGGVAIVVGGRASNWTESMRRHPQFVFFDTNDKHRHAELPSNARAVYFTRWVSHEWEKKLRKQANDRGLYCPPGLLSNGDIRFELELFMDAERRTREAAIANRTVVHAPVVIKAQEPIHVPPPPVPPRLEPIVSPPEPEPEPKPPVVMRSVRKGELKQFVIAHGDPFAPHIGDEAVRVHGLITDAGIETTTNSVEQAIRAYRGDMLEARRAGKAAAAPLAPPPAVERRASPPDAPQTAKRKSNVDMLTEAIAEAERYVDDLKGALATIQATGEILSELMPRIRREIEMFKEQQRKIREAAEAAAAAASSAATFLE